jgi:hypothetical protein
VRGDYIFRCQNGASVGFFQANDAGIRYFPAEIFCLALLLEMLLQKNGAAGIAYKSAGGRKANVSGAVLHFDWAAK